jgi:FKBP-type peptidyl-prolyl cis-trans isomerase SlyD
MQVQPNPKVISFHYTLKDTAGNVLESSFGDTPLSYLEGIGQIIPGLESALQGLKVGDKKSVHVKSEDAYGEYEDDLVVEVPKAQIPKPDVQVGDRFHADAGNGQMEIVVVTAVSDTHVTVNGNHPLSGQDLHFDVEITEVRDATSEELEHGHAHGPEGHDHH